MFLVLITSIIYITLIITLFFILLSLFLLSLFLHFVIVIKYITFHYHNSIMRPFMNQMKNSGRNNIIVNLLNQRINLLSIRSKTDLAINKTKTDLANSKTKTCLAINKTNDDDKFKIQIASDLHIENCIHDKNNIKQLFNTIIHPSAPTLALLGDIGVVGDNSINGYQAYKDFLLEASDRFERVIVIAGNHEYYSTEDLKISYSTIEELINNICASRRNLYFLQRNSILVNVGNNSFNFVGDSNKGKNNSGENKSREDRNRKNKSKGDRNRENSNASNNIEHKVYRNTKIYDNVTTKNKTNRNIRIIGATL